MSVSVISGLLDPILKEVWPEMSEMFYQKDQAMPLLEMIQSTNKIPFRGMTEGKYYKFPLITENGQNAAVGIGETDSLPYESQPVYDYVTGNNASHWQGIDISGFTMDMVDGGQASVTNVMSHLLQDSLTSFKKKKNWLLHQDGSQLQTGATNSTDTFTVLDASQLVNGMRFLYRHKSAGTLKAAVAGNTAAVPLMVSALNKTNKTFTAVTTTGATATVTTDASGDYGIYPHNGQGKGMYGLGAVCSAGNLSATYGATAYFMGKDATATGNEFWNPKEVDCNDVILDIQAHVQVLIDQIRADGLEFCRPQEDGVTWLVPTRWHNYRAISNAMRLDYRTTVDEKVLRSTYKTIEYEGAFFVPDNDAPVDELRFANLRWLRMFETVPLQWNNKSVEWLQGTSSADSRTNDTYKRWLYTRLNLFTVLRKVHGRIHDLLATA